MSHLTAHELSSLQDANARELLSALVHDWRSSLQGLQTNAEVLALTPLTVEAQAAVERLKKGVDGAMQRLEDLSRAIRSCQLVFACKQTTIALHACLDSAVQRVPSAAGQPPMRFYVRHRDHTPHRIEGNPERLRQILVNLLSSLKPGVAEAVTLEALPHPPSDFDREVLKIRALTTAYVDKQSTGFSVAHLLCEGTSWSLDVPTGTEDDWAFAICIR